MTDPTDGEILLCARWYIDNWQKIMMNHAEHDHQLLVAKVEKLEERIAELERFFIMYLSEQRIKIPIVGEVD